MCIQNNLVFAVWYFHITWIHDHRFEKESVDVCFRFERENIQGGRKIMGVSQHGPSFRWEWGEGTGFPKKGKRGLQVACARLARTHARTYARLRECDKLCEEAGHDIG